MYEILWMYGILYYRLDLDQNFSFDILDYMIMDCRKDYSFKFYQFTNLITFCFLTLTSECVIIIEFHIDLK